MGNRHAFVCGHPIGHSRSPLIHGYWLKQFDLSGSYAAVDVAPADFPAFLTGLPASQYVGGNVTIPHKEAAFSLVAGRDEAAELIGAVNTLWLEDKQVFGGNTDAYGFAANLDALAPGWDRHRTAVVLGAGGAARAVVFALQQRGFSSIRIVNRTMERARQLADRFRGGCSAHGWHELTELLGDSDFLVNTTSLGMDDAEAAVPDLANLPAHALVTDIVYVPLQTPLLKAAQQRELRTADGLGMLLHQAVPGFEKWFGRRPEVTEELRRTVLRDLEDRH